VTISGNASAANGGGILNLAGGTLVLNSSTLANNVAPGLGAGIRNQDVGGAVTLRNTIVADRVADDYATGRRLLGRRLDVRVVGTSANAAGAKVAVAKKLTVPAPKRRKQGADTAGGGGVATTSAARARHATASTTLPWGPGWRLRANASRAEVSG
jgi:hypothetical protein